MVCAAMNTVGPTRSPLVLSLADVRLADVELVPGTDMDDVQTFRFAADLATQGQWGEVVSLLEPLRARGSERCVRELLGRAYFARAQLARAEAVFRALVEEFPDDAYAREALARTLARLSRHGEAATQRRLVAALG